jgi:hypothetical protein
MNIKQQLMGVGCGALAGLTASIGITLWWAEFSFNYISIYDLYYFLENFQVAGPIGFIVGALIGRFMVLRMEKRAWQLRSWLALWSLLGMLSMSPWVILFVLFWLGARAGIASAGEPTEWIRAIMIALIIGGLAGSMGGIVGGFVFTRYSDRLSATT